MRVKISTRPPLPLLRAWFPLTRSAQTISAFKTQLCASLPALRNTTASSLRLSIDDFELLDDSELTIVRDGDLICIDASAPPQVVAPIGKRKRGMSTSSSSTSTGSTSPRPERKTLGSVPRGAVSCRMAPLKQKRRVSTSDTESTSSTSSESGSETESDSSDGEWTTQAPRPELRQLPSTTFVPPGYGKPQTRARNLRRRLKRIHEREGGASQEQPLSGANATATEERMTAPEVSGLMSLSLRNKNKAKNFRALIGKPLPPKIIFGDEETATPECPTPAEGTCPPQTRAVPRLIPPSSRSSLPPNLFVTSVDVEALPPDEEADAGEESLVEERWDTLSKLTGESQLKAGCVAGYKALGIDPLTCTPGYVLTVGRVQAWDACAVLFRPLRERGKIAFGGPVGEEGAEVAVEEHTWESILGGDWRVAA